MSAPLRSLGIILAMLLLGGCATTEQPDPLERINRVTFSFNQTVDDYIIAPPARVYRDNVPSPVQTGVRNVFRNLGDAWSAVNLMLQGRPAEGIESLMRFSVNTVLGFGGLLDWASEFGIQRHTEDFGQTLGRWGVGPGAYLVLPILGPSTVRDTAALPLDFQAATYFYPDDSAAFIGVTALRVISVRADLLSSSKLLDEIALDKYLFVRDGFLQRRQSQIFDGRPQDDDSDEQAPSDGGAAR
jgi:phospholipid-binding lipoprotein MlaA